LILFCAIFRSFSDKVKEQQNNREDEDDFDDDKIEMDQLANLESSDDDNEDDNEYQFNVK
jgi:hypothetical protein